MRHALTILLLASPAVVVFLGCDGSQQGTKPAESVILVEGSDTMVNIAQAWAERYHAENPGVSVQVLGGGSGVGIASLTDGNCDMANSSRDMKEEEAEVIRQKRGVDPVEHIVGFDALAVYVHPENPIESISLEELAEIYGEGGTTTRWPQLGVEHRIRGHDEIVRLGRQNSSGTYTYFREVVLGKKRDFKLGSVDRSGSKDLVDLVSRTPLAIGYSGMGYAVPGVKMLPVSRRKGEPAVAPTVANARNRTYPLTRALQIYTAGPLEGPAAVYMDWIFSPPGQRIVVELGYVPMLELK
ncbi:MAG: PstS family phosphate ABC transporter substrate-binding protein [Thermoguttaceae bacterium]